MKNHVKAYVRAIPGGQDWAHSHRCYGITVDGVVVPGEVISAQHGEMNANDAGKVTVVLSAGKFETVPFEPWMEVFDPDGTVVGFLGEDDRWVSLAVAAELTHMDATALRRLCVTELERAVVAVRPSKARKTGSRWEVDRGYLWAISGQYRATGSPR